MPVPQYDTRQWAFIDPDNPCPFEEILAPLVDAAHRRYEKQAGASYALLNTESHLTLHRYLLQVLVSLSVQTLHEEFSRAYTQVRALSVAKQHEQPVDEQTFYKHFITQMSGDGMVSLFNQYPALAHLLTVTCDHWIEANVEFLQRLHSDWDAIEQTFGVERASGQVTEIQPALSDSHNGRRTVMALTFASGYKLVYKPRNIGMEESFYRLLSWCNEQGVGLPCKTLTTLNRSDYGWVEFVEQEPCQDERAVQRYYQRAGMLLCLVYVLGGVNCTCEHFIAHGEYPVLVDAGTLLHAYPCPQPIEDRIQIPADWEAHSYSVLHTGLLTNWLSPMKAAHATDISAFGIDSQPSTAERKKQHAHSPRHQQIALKYGALRAREHLNIPLLNGVPTRIEEYKEDIIQGFRQLYLLLLSKQATLMHTDSPFQHFKRQLARMLYRPSWSYGAILPRFLTPEHLRNGFDSSTLIEQAGQYLIPVEYPLWGKGDWSRWQALADGELDALMHGDIPFFTRRTDSTTLVIADNQEIANCFHQSGFDLMISRLQTLSHLDMNRQIGYVEHVLCARGGDAVPPHAVDSGIASNKHAVVTRESLKRAFVNEALSLADTLVQKAILLPDGGATWLHAKFLSRSQHYQYRPMGYSLFDGLSGVALFLSVAANISGDVKYRNLSLAAVQTIRQQLEEYGHVLIKEMGIGGAIGLGSVVYALTRISQFLDEPDLLLDAKRAAARITAEQIADDKALDIIAGSAGTLLGLLALYDASQDQSVLAQAMLCGQHLLQSRTMSKAGCLAWPTLGEKHTTGFAHGIAGIAYAVLRLYNTTRNTHLLEASEEALHYEHAAFISKIDNWVEELGDSESMVMATWCHGAPGIGLARLGGLSCLDTPRIRSDIEAALRTTQGISPGPLDFLCCGNLGRAELLLAAGQQLDRPELTDTARHHAWQVLTRAKQQGRFHLNKALPDWVDIPNFFHGISGIGYELLRIAYPDAIPSTLLWM